MGTFAVMCGLALFFIYMARLVKSAETGSSSVQEDSGEIAFVSASMATLGLEAVTEICPLTLADGAALAYELDEAQLI
jgi:hypothetical protein